MKKKQRPDFMERSFGISVGTVLLLIAGLLIWRGRIPTAEVLGGVGAVLLVLGLTRPRLLKWPSAVWWKFAMILGYVNARVILTVAFAIVLAPLGLVWRVIGKDPLARHRKNWPGWSPSPERYRNPDHFNRMY
ncbi:MAG: SxtJ family membrane protein [Acidobacteriota bacterium]|nr:SxtJ family membrane protein [Acidobacteriota bacterium]